MSSGDILRRFGHHDPITPLDISNATAKHLLEQALADATATDRRFGITKKCIQAGYLMPIVSQTDGLLVGHDAAIASNILEDYASQGAEQSYAVWQAFSIEHTDKPEAVSLTHAASAARHIVARLVPALAA